MDKLVLDLEHQLNSGINAHANLFINHIEGQLTQTSLQFLEGVTQRDAYALEKIIQKCTQLKIQLKATDINTVIDALQHQHLLSPHLSESLQDFLINTHMSSFFQTLIKTTEQLNQSLDDIDTLKITMDVMSQLTLYHHTGIEKDFLTTTITMMLYFLKNENMSSAYHKRQRSVFDAAKWIKSLLSISEKSKICKLIDIIAERLLLMTHQIPGQIRQMDLIELFCLFEEISIRTSYFASHESNRTLLADMQVMISLASIAERAPNAFFDILYSQQSQSNHDLLCTLQNQTKHHTILSIFLNGPSFKSYFRECGIRTHSNQQAFLSSLARWMHHISRQAATPKEHSKAIIIDFLEETYSLHSQMHHHEFLSWLDQAIEENELFIALTHDLFSILSYEANQMRLQSGSLTFLTNQLLSMKRAPKAMSISQTGVFQPLITSNALQIDIDNLSALFDFFQKLNHKQQRELLSEMCILGAIPKKRPTINAKTTNKRPCSQHYPTPSLHRIQKKKHTTPITRVARQKPKRQQASSFFEPLTKIKSIKSATRCLVRH